MRRVLRTNRRRITRDRDLRTAQERHSFIANQIAMASNTATMAAHITGVTCFELPLRGESLAAWLNS
jgi:hypothetical protein